MATDQGLQWLPLIQQFSDTTTSNKIDLIKSQGQSGKELRCMPNDAKQMKRARM